MAPPPIPRRRREQFPSYECKGHAPNVRRTYGLTSNDTGGWVQHPAGTYQWSVPSKAQLSSPGDALSPSIRKNSHLEVPFPPLLDQPIQGNLDELREVALNTLPEKAGRGGRIPVSPADRLGNHLVHDV